MVDDVLLARTALKRFINDKVLLDGFQRAREREVRKPKPALAERLKIADVAAITPNRAIDAAPDLLI